MRTVVTNKGGDPGGARRGAVPAFMEYSQVLNKKTVDREREPAYNK